MLALQNRITAPAGSTGHLPGGRQLAARQRGFRPLAAASKSAQSAERKSECISEGPNVIYRPATPEDNDATAAMFVQAFHEDPLSEYMYKGLTAEKYSRALASDFSSFTKLLFAKPGSISWCAVDANTDNVVGAAVLTPSEHEPSLIDLLQALSEGDIPPWSNVIRIVQVLYRYITARLAVDKSLNISAEIEFFGIAPSHQGQGVGRQLLQKVLQQWDSEYEGAVALFASSARGKQLYSKEGFKVLEEVSLAMGGDEVSLWHMYRPASSTEITPP